MTDSATHFEAVAAVFSAKARQVAASDWDNPAPCEGWVARDVVRHLVEWLPSFFFDRYGVAHPVAPHVDEDPVGAWESIAGAFRSALHDPAVAARVEDTPIGPMSFAAAVDMICTPDVFLHTWDLARATGLDERLDADEVHRMLEGMEPLDEVLRQSGHYGAPGAGARRRRRADPPHRLHRPPALTTTAT